MDKPYVSIIIPCPPGKTPEAIEHLKKLNYPQEKCEIIIEEGYNPSAQRNRGIKKAKGDIIGFTDDDCSMDPNWLENTIKYFSDSAVGVVGGPNLTPRNSSLLSTAFGLAMGSYFGAASMSTRYKKNEMNGHANEQHLILNNMFVKNEIFKKGLFLNETLFPNEENEFLNRVSKHNYKMIYAKDVSVYHPRKSTFKDFTRQVFGYGTGRAKQTNIQPDSFKLLYLMPTLFVLGIVGLPLSILLHQGIITGILLLCLISYFIVSTTVSLKIAITERKIKIFPLMPMIFFIIHVSYGTGFMLKSLDLKLNMHKKSGNSLSHHIKIGLSYPLIAVSSQSSLDMVDLMSAMYL